MISIFEARNKADQVNNFDVLLSRISGCIEDASAKGLYHINYTHKDGNVLQRLFSYFERSTQFDVTFVNSSTIQIYWG